MMYLGDFGMNSVITFPFTTHEADGGAVAPSSAFEAADIRIYRGASATERASSSGITMTSPFDSVTGLHMLSIDTSDNADFGFYDATNDYHVILVPDETVDGQTVVKVLASFSIENRFTEVTATAVGSAAITSASFAGNAITAGVIATGAITAAKFAAGAIDAAAIADNAIDAGAIATGAITAAKFAAGAIDANALAADAVDEILDEVVEGSLTMRQVLRLFLASLAGKAAGGGTTTITFRDNADSKNRISATVDASGNRTAVTLDGS